MRELPHFKDQKGHTNENNTVDLNKIEKNHTIH